MAWGASRPTAGSLGASGEVREQWEAIERSLWTDNWVADPLFQIWHAGDAAAPAHWRLTGTGAAIARSGAGVGDGIHNNMGGFASKVTFGSALAMLEQTLIPTLPTYWRGKTVVAAVAARTSNLSQARLEIFDGVSNNVLGNGLSAYHTGGGAFEWLTCVRVLDAAATKVDIRLRAEVAGSVYWQAPVLMFGFIPPQYFVPCPHVLGTWKWGQPGDCAVDASVDEALFALPTLITDVMLRIGTAPATQALIVDLETWDGSTWQTMFTTGAPANTTGRPHLAAGEGGRGKIPDGTYRYRCLGGAAGNIVPGGNQIVRGAVDQVGTGTVGADLKVMVRGMQFMRPQQQLLAPGEIN